MIAKVSNVNLDTVTPDCYLIGGPNGAGKTTIAMQILATLLNCPEYVNADLIASALSPFHPESVAQQAGRLMLERLHNLASSGESFAFESTLSARSFARFIADCEQKGYTINLIYVWLNSADLAVERVAQRVNNGGHRIPEEVIRRRYERSRRNLLQLYLPLCDRWSIYDNSTDTVHLIADYTKNKGLIIPDPDVWKELRQQR